MSYYRSIFDNDDDKHKSTNNEPTTVIVPVPYVESAAKPSLFSRKANQMTLREEQAEEHDKAQLAATIMQCAAGLSVLEAHCTNVAPSGKARYKTIADSYTVSSATDLMRRRSKR